MVYHIITFVVAFLALSIGVTIITKKTQYKARIFLIATLGLILWSSTRLLPFSPALSTPISDVELEIISRWTLIGSLFLAFGLVIFSYVFPYQRCEISTIRTITWVGMSMLFLLAVPILLTNGFIQNANTDTGLQIMAGPWYEAYVGILSILYLWIFILLGKSYRESKGKHRKEAGFMMGAILIALIPPYIAMKTPMSLQGVVYLPLWDMAVNAGVGIVFVYVLIRYDIFDLKLAGFDFLLIGMAVTLIFITIGSKSPLIFTAHLVIMCIFAILAFYYIQELVEEKRRNKQIISANKQLRENLESKEHFLRLTAHQLRTPLSGIQGYLELIREGSPKAYEYPDEVLEDIKNAHVNYQRLHSIVEDISIANHLSAKSLDISLSEKLNLQQLIQNLQLHIQPLADKHNVELILHLLDTSPMIKGDRSLLRDALENILENAIMYDASSVEISLKQRDSQAIIKIIDDGMGITEEEQTYIKKRFQRAERASNRHPDGSGMGLYITEAIIEKHGGSLELFSEGKGSGTVVTLNLPLISI